jgi:hypothetical protein
MNYRRLSQRFSRVAHRPLRHSTESKHGLQIDLSKLSSFSSFLKSSRQLPHVQRGPAPRERSSRPPAGTRERIKQSMPPPAQECLEELHYAMVRVQQQAKQLGV